MGKLEIPSPLFFNAAAVKGLEPETGVSRDRIPSRIILDVRMERQAGLATFPSSPYRPELCQRDQSPELRLMSLSCHNLILAFPT